MTASPVMSAPEEDDEIDLMALGSVLWAGKWLILVVTLVAGLVGVFDYVVTPRTYQADALVQVEPKSSGFAATAMSQTMQTLLGTSDSPVEGEIAIMNSRMVVGAVVDSLKLDWIATPKTFPVIGDAVRRGRLGFLQDYLPRAYARPGDAIHLGDLTVPLDWIDLPITATVLGQGKLMLDFPDGTTTTGMVGKPIADEARGYSILVSSVTGAPGRQFVLMRLQREEAIQNIQKSLSVSENPKGSSILTANYKNASPEMAQKILEAIAKAYVNQNIDRSAAEATKSLEFVQSQKPSAKAAVDAAQNALTAYQTKNKTVDLTLQTQSLLTAITGVQTQLNDLAVQEATLKQNYTVNHPAYQALLKKRAELETQLTGLEKEAKTLPEAQKRILDLTSNLQVAQQAYTDMLGRIEQLKILASAAIGNVRLIDNAVTAPKPVAPRTLIVALAGVLGLILGSGIVLGRSFLMKGIRGAEDIERLGIPVFATIGYSRLQEADLARAGRANKWPILSIEHSDDPVPEAIRSLRTSLHFGMLDSASNAVMFTSAAPGAGKSFISANLAVVAAQTGQRVCLIDADMRRGSQRHYFDVRRNTPGLSEVLAGEISVDDALIAGPTEGLSVLVSGRFPPNPSELLMRKEFTDLLKALNDRFDLIIVDAPPTLAVTDPVVISKSVAAVIVVVRHLETLPGAVAAVQKAFQSANVRISGAVLNGFKAEQSGYYGTSNYSYAYNYRYAYKSDKKDG